MKVRIKFQKHGAIRFIGHLDVMRFFQKTIRRAGLDVAYSGGYSPHQIMSFASPLGVGLESNGEYMDIEVNSLTSCADTMERLNQASVPGIQVVSVKVLPEGAGNAMASVAAAAYTVRFREGREPDVFGNKAEHEIARLLEDFLAQEEIVITKEGKNGPREVDIKPGIYELKWTEHTLSMLVDASSAGNIKPIQVIDAILSLHGEKLAENALLITREETYMLSNDGNTLVSLDDIGIDDEKM
ncbi:MAG: TIGR03936 family radical SAM-associated protein [Lachnospiraceae bacterium]|nr:TIGR03936 family radical SAM-associated protein [Lachnospiraceae bacterium]